jgi:hypothetical protein
MAHDTNLHRACGWFMHIISLRATMNGNAAHTARPRHFANIPNWEVHLLGYPETGTEFYI